MTTFKVIEKQNAYYGHEFPEYTKFERYHAPCSIVWIPLLVAPNKVVSFALSNLSEVKAAHVPFMTDLLYTCAEPPPVTCTTLTIWRPVIELPITELGHYREGQKGYPGVSLTMSNVLLVLSMPDETELANVA